MADIVDLKTRSRMMSGIKGKNTKPELALRSALHKRGFRYRLHRRIEGARPDMTLKRYRAAIFVHGCFWHRHSGCSKAATPSTRVEFWEAKFLANIDRDRRNISRLREAGWRVAVVWECALTRDKIDPTVGILAAWLKQGGNARSVIEL